MKRTPLTDTAATWTRCREISRRRLRSVLLAGCATLFSAIAGLAAFIDTARAQDTPREQYVPVLCVTTGEHPVGEVISVQVLFATREDARGLDIHFLNGPGRLSPKTQTAIAQAIASAARVFGLSTDSWSIGLSVPYPGFTIEGDSLSAMVGLTVVAMAKGEAIPRHRVISGTVTSDGRIGPVGDVPLKVAAAYQAGLHMVLVPATSRGNEKMPHRSRVSSVRTVLQAYQALMAPTNLMSGNHRPEVDVR